MTDFFDDLINSKKSKKKTQKPSLLTNLYKVPKRDPKALRPTFQVPHSGVVHQADLLSLPEDKKYKYALVIVDCSSKKCDAQPLKSKTAVAVLEAFKTIYNRSVLSLPTILEIDAGAEFKGVVAK
jgi:hypothetical protein